MCNARLIVQVSATLLQGPASDAVEQSSKRLRPCSSAGTKTFSLDALFHTVNEETFPSIGWDLESSHDQSYSTCSMSSSFSESTCCEDDEDDFESFRHAKRARCGMVRSISIMTDLALLEPSSEDLMDARKASLLHVKKLDEVLMRGLHRTPLRTTEHVSLTACAS